jgi:hypothetical protein
MNRKHKSPKAFIAFRNKGRLIVKMKQILERPEMTRGGKNVD